MSAPTQPGIRQPAGDRELASRGGGALDVHDPQATAFELVREGAQRDGVEIMLYEPRLTPGSRAEQRMVRIVASLFLLGGGAATAFVVAYIFWPWEYEFGADALSKFYTPILGVTLGLSLFGLGAAIVAWTKKLLPHEVAVETRHDGPSSDEDRRLMAGTLTNALDETGVMRRPLLKGAIALGLAPLGVVAAAPLIGGLIQDPHRNHTGLPGFNKSPQDYTGYNPAFVNNGDESGPARVRLVREDGTPIRPAEISVGGQLTVFPGIPGGTTNEFADSPVLLIHLREEDATRLRGNLYPMNDGSMEGNFVAYSKICTHAGCPPSLFEQQTNLLLCPCHQSQFLITDNARPVFGPAARSLPMLPIGLDGEGFFVATSDFKAPVGPSFWEL